MSLVLFFKKLSTEAKEMISSDEWMDIRAGLGHIDES